jgi:DNA-binding PadR family transcriptional regulator
LYAALERLRTEKLIEVDREEIVESRLRRYYRLTPAGAEHLAKEADRLRSNAHVALSRLETSSGVPTT